MQITIKIFLTIAIYSVSNSVIASTIKNSSTMTSGCFQGAQFVVQQNLLWRDKSGNGNIDRKEDVQEMWRTDRNIKNSVWSTSMMVANNENPNDDSCGVRAKKIALAIKDKPSITQVVNKAIDDYSLSLHSLHAIFGNNTASTRDAKHNRKIKGAIQNYTAITNFSNYT